MFTYIIAEAGSNHGGSLQQACRLVIEAAKAGADAIKFQTFTAAEIAADVPILLGHDAAHDAWIRRLGHATLPELFATGGLPRDWHRDLARCAADNNIDFLSTPFSVDAARFLVEDVGVSRLKIASGDLTFTPLLTYANTARLPIILSTGGAFLSEIRDAITHLAGAQARHQLTILHCIASYPCDMGDAQLAMIPYLHKQLGIPIGWSDHTLSVTTVPVMAVAAGATLIEKHFVLTDASSKNLPDSGHSLGPASFTRMVAAVRDAERILGTPEKRYLVGNEAHDRLWARRDPSDWLRPTAAARAGQWAESDSEPRTYEDERDVVYG